MIFLKRLSIVLFVLLMLAMLAVYLTSLQVYVPQLERTLSVRLHIPVRIGSLQAGVLPLPHFELRDVLVGGQDGIALRSVEVSPALQDLLRGRLALHIEVKDGAAHLSQLGMLVEALSDAPPGRTPAMRELSLSGLILLTPELAAGPLEGKLEFAETGLLRRAWFALDEQKLTAEFLPLPDRRFAVQVSAKGWRGPQLPQSPQLSGLPIDELQLDGLMGSGELMTPRFTLVSQGMRVEGAGRLNFSDGLELHVQLRKAELPLERLMTLSAKPIVLTGMLSGRGRFDSRAHDWRNLVNEASFDGELRLVNVTARLSESFRRPLMVRAIKSRIALRPNRFELSALQAALYGGTLTGEMSLNRNSSLLNARLAVQEINMRSLVEALTNEVLFTGRMEGQARLSMNLDRLDLFPENSRLAGKFHLRNGTVSKVDLARTVNLAGKPGGAGGVTSFSDLTGELNMGPSGYHFSALKMSSGSLSAEGWIDMTPSLHLNGALDVDLKGTVGLVSMPLVVAGTLEHPDVSVSRVALAGAAVGTAVLGPGLGTALGSRLGGFMNKLFGNNSNSSRAQPKPHEGR